MSRNHTENIFDNLPALSAPRIRDLCDKLDRYLSTDPEHVIDVLMWWTERRSMYPHLSRMALDYLSIPGELTYTI
jgi:hAT family C-terminal dimerisation region